MKKRLSETAINQCVEDLRAACRRPIDESALTTIIELLRPNFEQILDHPEGGNRWADVGQAMRDNGRRLGALAEFFSHRSDVAVAGIEQFTQAFEMVRDACTVRIDRTTRTMPNGDNANEVPPATRLSVNSTSER